MAQQCEVAWTATAKGALQRLPEKVATAAIEFIYGSLANNPQRLGKALRLDLEGLHSARCGDYRIIYRNDERVTIIAIEHRADIFLKKAEEYLASAQDNLDLGRFTPAAGGAIHAWISAKDAIVVSVTGSTTKTKDHSSATKELARAWGSGPARMP